MIDTQHCISPKANDDSVRAIITATHHKFGGEATGRSEALEINRAT